MANRIHILGASGSGTTTLGRAMAERLNYTHFDTDAYFWLPTDPPTTEKREITLRQQLLMGDRKCKRHFSASPTLGRVSAAAPPPM
jgi:adenylate kinase family enzyme